MRVLAPATSPLSISAETSTTMARNGIKSPSFDVAASASGANAMRRGFAVAGTSYLLEGHCGLLESDTGPWRRQLRRTLGGRVLTRRDSVLSHAKTPVHRFRSKSALSQGMENR
jgi:hypothetical protein